MVVVNGNRRYEREGKKKEHGRLHACVTAVSAVNDVCLKLNSELIE